MTTRKRLTELAVAILEAMKAAEDRREPASKAANDARRELRLNPIGYRANIELLWSERLITVVKVPQKWGAPDTLVPDGVTEAGRTYLSERRST